jgi:outer membrane protein assembly factor BamB
VLVVGGDPAHTGREPGPDLRREPALLWSAQTGGPVLSSPAVVDGVSYVGSLSNSVFAFDSDGNLI